MAADPIPSYTHSLGGLFSFCIVSANTHIWIRTAPMGLAVMPCIDRPPHHSFQLGQSGYLSFELGRFYKRDRGGTINNYNKILSINQDCWDKPGYVVNLCSHNLPKRLKTLPSINLSISSHHQRLMIKWSMWILSHGFASHWWWNQAICLLEGKNTSKSV